ncbi:MAG: EndoU domain-containing protein, partial [Patescibacteria group bacterium]|nr:EndoU domain-containing protein [Patescibacteria group bacterium]
IFGEETVALGGKLKAEVMGMFGGGGGGGIKYLGHLDTDVPKWSSESKFKHSIGGEIRGGELKGLHHVPSNSEVVHISSQPHYLKNSDGFYEADVEIVHAGKSYSKNRSTMWPDSWSQSRIAHEANIAFKNKKFDDKTGGYIGTTSQGVKVYFYNNGGSDYNFHPSLR